QPPRTAARRGRANPRGNHASANVREFARGHGLGAVPALRPPNAFGALIGPIRCPIVRFTIVTFILAIACASVGQAAQIATIAGNGRETYAPDEVIARQAAIGQPFGLVIGPDAAL